MGASDPIELAAEIVAAFVSNNPLPKSDLPALIHAMHTAVASLSETKSAPAPVEAKEPAVPIRRSITAKPANPHPYAFRNYTPDRGPAFQ